MNGAPRGRSVAPPSTLLPGLLVLCCLALLAMGWVLYRQSRPWQAVVQVMEPQVHEARHVIPAVSNVASLEPYRGLGTWLDAFDYSPAYDVEPAIGPLLDDMAAHGVRTVFVQSGRLDDRSPATLEDRWVLAELLMQAHQRDMHVVAWFLPKWTDPDADLSHLVAAARFEVVGHRFDGVAVDIEWNQDGLDPQERSARLVDLSRRLDEAVPDQPLGAIVMPPVLLEVINPDFWPEFPWTEIAPHYDVWLPMSYWSFRSNESGYGDGYAYNHESTIRLRANLNDPSAPVHGIGGIGASGAADRLQGQEPIASIDALDLFAESLVDSGSIGGSVYDWNTTEPDARTLLRDLFSEGPAAELGAG